MTSLYMRVAQTEPSRCDEFSKDCEAVQVNMEGEDVEK